MLFITDHRGRRHEIAATAMSEESRRGAGRQLLRLRVYCILVLLAAYGVLYKLILSQVMGPRYVEPFLLAAAAGAMILALAWLTDRALANRPWWYGPGAIPDHRRAMLSACRCPACAYPLDKSTPAADGCHVCPECGAAWKLPRPPAR